MDNKKYKKEFVALLVLTLLSAGAFAKYMNANTAITALPNTITNAAIEKTAVFTEPSSSLIEQRIKQLAEERDDLVVQLEREQQRSKTAARQLLETKIQTLLQERDLLESELIKAQFQLEQLVKQKKELSSLFDNNYQPPSDCESPTDNNTLIQCINGKRQAKQAFLAKNGF